MATITEDYVSFETAKMLKEKGFDVPCRSNYRSCYQCYKVPFYHNTPKNFNGKEYEGLNSEWFSAPTLQMAMKWLREVHNIHISVYPFNRELPITEDTSYTCDVATEKISPMRGHLRGIWKTYEEAVEAAIKYALENLI